MTKKIILLAFALVFVTLIVQFTAYTNSSQPPSARTGAPGEANCTACHNTSSANSGAGSVKIEFANNVIAKYLPDSTYELTVTVEQAAASKFGFELTALDANDETAGTFAVINSGNTAKPSSSNGRKYISHKNAGSTNSWTFKWKAPSDPLGAITFYAAGNAADGTGNTTGDFIYTTDLTVEQDSIPAPPPTAVGHNDQKDFSVKVFNGKLMIFFNQPESGQLALYDLSGRLMTTSQTQASSAWWEAAIMQSELKPGIYLVTCKTATGVASQKIYIN